MEQERLWILLARKLAHEASEEELIEFENLLRENPEIHLSAETLHQLWNAASKKQTKYDDLKKLFRHIQEQNQHDTFQGLPVRNGRDTKRNFFKTNHMFKNYFKLAI